MVRFPSLCEGLARTVSTNKERNGKKDAGKGAAETMAKDARKRELMLTSSGIVKSSGCNNFASISSRRGQKGTNQDCLVVWEEFGCQEDMVLCGVFDGHGPWGHIVSKWIRKSMPPSLLCNWQQSISMTSLGLDFRSEFDRDLHQFDLWKKSYLKTYAAMDQELKKHTEIDSFSSGTTALTIVKQARGQPCNDNLVIANVGDSMVVLATTCGDGNFVPIQLTVDMKPNLPQEAERIRQSTGRIFCLEDEPGDYRVWGPNGKSPGLALSRAIGDYCVKDFGLISVPDVTNRRLTSSDQFIILATDGVWDVVSNEEAVEIVESSLDKESSVKRLMEHVARGWKFKKKGIAMDDISAICLFFH